MLFVPFHHTDSLRVECIVFVVDTLSSLRHAMHPCWTLAPRFVANPMDSRVLATQTFPFARPRDLQNMTAFGWKSRPVMSWKPMLLYWLSRSTTEPCLTRGGGAAPCRRPRLRHR